MLAEAPANTNADVTAALTTAAADESTADQARANGTYVTWALATLLAVLLASYLGLYLVRAVGATGVDFRVDLALTGLVIRAGSKPLHDLISTISKSSAAADTSSPGGS